MSLFQYLIIPRPRPIVRLIGTLIILGGINLAAATNLVLKNSSITEHTTWKDTVVISGTVKVESGAHLKIEPGTKVLFEYIDSDRDGAGESLLFILGSFAAVGTQAAPIYFGPQDPSSQIAAYWEGIYFIVSESADNIIAHSQITGANRGVHMHFAQLKIENTHFHGNQRAIQFQESVFSLKDSLFSQNHNGMHFRNSTVLIEGTIFRDNRIGLNALRCELSISGSKFIDQTHLALNVRESKLTISESIFSGNRRGPLARHSQVSITGSQFNNNVESGLSIHYDSSSIIENNIFDGNGTHAIRVKDCQVLINNNTFSNTNVYAINLSGKGNLVATGNKLIPPESPQKRLYDSTNDPALGRIFWN